LRQNFGEIRIGKGDAYFSLSKAEGEFNGVGQATSGGWGKSDSIDDKFYSGLGGVCLKFDDLCFLTDTQKALFFQASRIGMWQRCEK
jgi:hypothetical protein